ncbi:hypothetical protein A7985_04130 [Pseudoalteromonas luteoviolacea]|uniref:Uncharacterized protein n=1 Tax=Pseudoalteromonas luteoviolacea TaxID=43657 RepID=A0A1C0TUZ3_9GAMM|nr:hypothetical protein [Pseudoalteromonas luteoviolacea]OCQ23146.1 hypothetical protein A7985_04130 [Pseudoalteromonas luteoviolacea]
MNLTEKWSYIEAELISAFELLPSNIVESDNGYRKKDFFDYIKANELLLAMEELDGVIEDNPSQSKEFWQHLINASKLMGNKHLVKYESIIKAT